MVEVKVVPVFTCIQCRQEGSLCLFLGRKVDAAIMAEGVIEETVPLHNNRNVHSPAWHTYAKRHYLNAKHLAAPYGIQ